MITPLKLWFEDFLKTHQDRYQNIKILSSWDEIIGKELALMTRAKKVYQETLIVEVKEKEWQIELFYHVGDILEKYKKRFPEMPIKKVYFKYNPYFEKKEIATVRKKEVSRNKDVFQESNIKGKDRDKSRIEVTHENLAESVSRLKKIWNELKEIRAKETKQNFSLAKPLETENSDISLENRKSRQSNRSASIEKFYSLNQIHSEFLKNQDEFQPFDLY